MSRSAKAPRRARPEDPHVQGRIDPNLVYRSMSFQYIPRVARGEQNLDAFAQPPRFAGKLNAVHAVWHHDIAKQQLKFLATLEHLDGLRAIPGAKNLIAE